MDPSRQVIINDMKACARRRGLAIEDAFQDYDVKGTGAVSYGDFRKVLSYIGFWSDESKLTSATADCVRDNLFHYREFLSTSRPLPGPTVPDRILTQFGISLKTKGFTVREWYRAQDPLMTGRISTLNFLRATQGDAAISHQIAAAYKFPTSDEVDYFRLAGDVDQLMSQRATPTVVLDNLPPFFTKIAEVFSAARVDPIGTFMIADRYKRNRITGQQFSHELAVFGVALSPPQWQELVSIFSDDDGVDYRKFCEELRAEVAKLSQKSKPEDGEVDMQVLLKNLAEIYRNRHSQIDESFRDSDPRNTGQLPTFRFFRVLTVSQFKLSPREVAAIEKEFRVDGATIDYRKFLSVLAVPKTEAKSNLPERLREFLQSRFIQLKPILQRFDRDGIGSIALVDLFSALRTISFDLNSTELQFLRQRYSQTDVAISEFCDGIDYEPAPILTPPPGAFTKPAFAEKAARSPPSDHLIPILDSVAHAVDEFKIELFNEFRTMDTLRQGVIPVLRFEAHLTNIGVRGIAELVRHYQKANGIDYSAFIEDLQKYGKSDKRKPELSAETKQLLMLLKAHIVVHQTSVQALFYRYDSGRTSRVLKSRVPGVLSAMGLSPSAAEVQHLCDDFSDPKMAEYIAYKPIVQYVDALDIGDEELRSVTVSASNAAMDREIWAMLNTFREKLLARRRSPYDAFKGCAAGGIAQRQFREGLANLGLVMREGEIQKLMRKYRCNLKADVDWASFCRDIEASRTLDFGTE